MDRPRSEPEPHILDARLADSLPQKERQATGHEHMKVCVRVESIATAHFHATPLIASFTVVAEGAVIAHVECRASPPVTIHVVDAVVGVANAKGHAAAYIAGFDLEPAAIAPAARQLDDHVIAGSSFDGQFAGQVVDGHFAAGK